jgi:uncharacterized membrane protein SirB2
LGYHFLPSPSGASECAQLSAHRHNAAHVATRAATLLKDLHVAFAYLTVASFVARGLLSIAESPLRNAKWIKIAPHVIDTFLLLFGIALAVTLAISPLANGWLMAKIVALVAYIGFGVMAMRAKTRRLKIVGFVAAIAAVGYIFAVAYSKQVMPF